MKNKPVILKPLLKGIYTVIVVSMAVAMVLGICQKNTEMILYSAATILLLFVPTLIRNSGIELQPLMELFCILFLFASVTLAKLFDFYTLIPSWDLILHFFSGPLLTAIGVALLGLWSFGGKRTDALAPLFVALFGFFFSMTVAGVWEFYEFFADTCFGTQMQKYELRDGVLDTGLLDTMTDMLVAALGSLLYAVGTWFDLKCGKGTITNRLYFRKK